MNVSYRKNTLDGVVLNPIVTGRPLVHFFPNRRQRRMKSSRLMSNTQGLPMISTRIGTNTFIKYLKRVQIIPADSRTEITVHTEGKSMKISRKPTKARTLVHYQLVN